MTPWQHMIGRKPFMIGGPVDTYMRRWFVIPRNRWFNIYLHHFLRSDDDRALHSHPWSFNISILLKGSYIEHTPKGEKLRTTPCFAFRHGEAWHRVELIENCPVWTIFITGWKIREWGFACPKGFVHWADFTNRGDDGATIGRGCD